MADEVKFRLVVDVKKRQPGCVILQAAYGGDVSTTHLLPSEAWLTFPTDDMRMVSGTKAEWEKFAEELKKRFSKRLRTAPKNRG